MATPQTKPTIEARLRAIEDRLEIYNLIASHPPAADAGADYYTRAVYLEDGEIDLCGGKTRSGNEAIGASQSSAGHMAAVAGGLAHFAGLPRIDLHGDEAVVTSYLQILTPHPTAEPHEVPHHGSKQGLSHPPRRRQPLVAQAHPPDGWKIKRRTLRSLDGSEPAREILRGALKAFAPPA